MIEAKKLTFSINNLTLLTDFNMSFETGKIYALIGHNGSGKSTLLKLLAQQQTPTSGNIYYRINRFLLGLLNTFAQQVAYLPQHTPDTNSYLVAT